MPHQFHSLGTANDAKVQTDLFELHVVTFFPYHLARGIKQSNSIQLFPSNFEFNFMYQSGYFFQRNMAWYEMIYNPAHGNSFVNRNIGQGLGSKFDCDA